MKLLRYLPDYIKLWLDHRGRRIAIVEITLRTLLRMFLLRPTHRNTELIRGVIGRAQAKYDFALYNYNFLSNHGSMLIGVTDAEHMADIMCFIAGNMARELGRPENSNWPGRFWGRRYRPITVASDAALLGRMQYISANGTKEGLVKHPREWPGACANNALCTGEVDFGLWVHRTYHADLKKKASKRQAVPIEKASTKYPLHLSKIPPLAQLSDEEYQAEMRDMCDGIASESALEREKTGRPVLGVRRILEVHPHSKPTTKKNSPAPFVHCHNPAFHQAFRAAYRAFVSAYREAYVTLHAGLSGFPFPHGGHPPVKCRVLQAG
jgi:hypothetical protein